VNAISEKEVNEYKPMEVEAKILPISTLFDNLISIYGKDPKEIEGWPTRSWLAFNEAFGGARPRELIVLTADSGTGKSTFALNWALEMMRVKHTTFLISLEMTWTEVAVTLANRIGGKRFPSFVAGDMAAVKGVLDELNGYYLDQGGAKSLDFIVKAIKYATAEKGCRFIVLDHFGYIQREKTNGWEGATIIGDMVRRLVTTAKQTNSTIVLIVHPSKLDDKGVKSREVGMDELKGSSDIKQEASAVMSLYRSNEESGESILRFQKIRSPLYGRYRGSFIRFQFDPRNLEYRETSVRPEWGKP
jgi:replicative DNA helicase